MSSTVTRVAVAADMSDVHQRVDAGMLKVVASRRGRRGRIVCAAENKNQSNEALFTRASNACRVASTTGQGAYDVRTLGLTSSHWTGNYATLIGW
jgi:hypothetical protein